MCVPGFRSSSNQERFITNDGTICVDIDECSESAVCGDHALCKNMIGGYKCSCEEGYQISTGKTQFISNDGTYCQENVNPDCHLDSACINATIHKAFKKLRHIETVALLQEVYKNSVKDLSPMDIITYIEILTESSPLLGYTNTTSSAKDTPSNSTLTEFIKTVNNIIQKDTFTIWDRLPTNLRRTHLTKLMHTVEQTTLKISQNFQKTIQQFDTNSSDIDKNRRQCAFWNYSLDTMNGSWSSEGCELTYSNETHTSCRCDHLTHFAILMSPSSSIGTKDYNILTRITQLGIIISLICLAICIFTFWFFSEIQSTRTTIHKNLCCSLFLAELVFLVGINTSTNKLFCSIIAGLLHYFFLAAFAWMCIEGIHLYLIVVGVIYNKGFLHKNFYIFGYLSPAVVVGFSAALGYRYYGTTK
ncbi:Adhesion G protein-coupled receptor L4, partial [Galemys pyrenaicus]